MASMTVDQAFELGLKHHRAGRVAQAESLYRQVLARQPDHARALQMMGMAAHQGGRSAEGIGLLRRAIELDPQSAECHGNLGVVLAARGALAEAAACFRQAIALRPDLPEMHNNLGNALKDQGHPMEAISVYRQALSLRPGYAAAHYNLGGALLEAGHLEPAIAAFRQAIAIQGDYPDAYNNLGNALNGVGRPDEAIGAFEKAVALRPDYAEALNNLAGVLQETARLREAIGAYRRSLAIRPDARVASNLALAVHLGPDDDPKRIFEEQARWSAQYERPLPGSIARHENDPGVGRRLRIGYVSPDFNSHPVGRFMLPLLANHDRGAFEIFCYSDVRAPDEWTARLAAHADVWREMRGIPDEQLARQIRDDRIDVLVDLAMHTRHNRLPVFARKPAPVQATYLAYCSTTGLKAMDYRLTDPFLEPPQQDDQYYCEQAIRLPRSYYCFHPPDQTPEPDGPRPLAAGPIVFGSLNKSAKVTPAMLALWGQILRQCPDSALLLYCPPGSARERAAAMIAGQGVAANRIQFADYVGFADYMRQYRRIGIALDTFPYPGATTTCDALWMGVPTISLAGRSMLSRVGLSILSNIGLPELVAQSPHQYVQIASELARDLPRLAGLRATLRRRMEASPLMDAPALARGIEAAYRQMWYGWTTRRR